MPHLQRNSKSWMERRFICFLSLFILLSLSVPCIAQQEPLKSADLDSKVIKVDVKSATLETMVALLAKQMHCNIVVDDSPHHAPIDFSMETTVRIFDGDNCS